MKEYIEREAAVAAAQAIVDAVQIDPDWERETRKEYLGEKRGAKAVQDVLCALPAAPVDALVNAARYAKDIIGLVLLYPEGHDVPTYLKAASNELKAALDGEPK